MQILPFPSFPIRNVDMAEKGKLPAPSPLRADEKLYRLARGDLVKVKQTQFIRTEKGKDDDSDKQGDDDKTQDDGVNKDGGMFFSKKLKRLSEQLQHTLVLNSDDGGPGKKDPSKGETKRKITF